ncbi:hypothetical protein AX14_005787 [Amanita brunnescens Koide BX004]|nr:hypothetical protein AX14_005787 [Amanita brunnescens Koide BX004]
MYRHTRTLLREHITPLLRWALLRYLTAQLDAVTVTPKVQQVSIDSITLGQVEAEAQQLGRGPTEATPGSAIPSRSSFSKRNVRSTSTNACLTLSRRTLISTPASLTQSNVVPPGCISLSKNPIQSILTPAGQMGNIRAASP